MANRISGIKNIHLALYNVEEGTYKTPEKVVGAKSLSVKDNVSSVTFFSDNVADFNASQLSSKEVALMYELTTLSGKSIYNVLYNVKLAKDGSEAKTMEEGIDEQTVKLVGTAIPNAEGHFDYVLDANYEPTEPGEKSEFNNKITNWFTTVQLPTPAEM